MCLCPFESFRRDFNEEKVVYISEYDLVCSFVIHSDTQLAPQLSIIVSDYQQ